MPDTTKTPSDRRDRRQARLEQALRENLMKRKALARKRAASGPADGENGQPGNYEAPTED
ncbi:MAG: hypothetical protein KJ587_17265 [Alphaproteobacteria bacterium]|nr:hypothetical protein [Alphaproteobacteria bacterium]